MTEGIIGIVGGVGPYAGLDLVKKIFDQTKATKDQDHLSVYLASESSKIPDRSDFLCKKTQENPGYAIAEVLKKLEKIGVTVAAVSCNTAHSPKIFDVVLKSLKKSNSKIRVLNIVDETVNFIKQNFPEAKKIGILGTRGTYKTNLYETVLKEKGFEPINPPEQIKHLVHKAIYDPDYGIKAKSSPITERAKQVAYEGVEKLQALGAQGIILGCTELPIAITEKKIKNTLIFDPTLILARTLVKAVSPEKLKPYDLK